MAATEDTFVIYDTEYWTDEGAHLRNWDGLDDKPPLLIQIGAFKVKRNSELTIESDYLSYVTPRDAFGNKVSLTECFTTLTGITQETLDEEGTELEPTLTAFSEFCGSDKMYSYSIDMLNTVVQSCFIAGVQCPFDAKKTLDVRQVLRKSSLTDKEISDNSSGTISGHLGISIQDHFAHDARNDAYSILVTLRHLLEKGDLTLIDL